MWKYFHISTGFLAVLGITTIISFIKVDAKEDPMSCIYLAECWAKYGDVLTEKGENASSKYEFAKYYIKRQEKYDSCPIPIIAEGCRNQFKACEAGYKSEAIDEMERKIGKSRVTDPMLYKLAMVIYDTRSACFDYTLYFCRMDKPGFWPDEIYNAIKLKYKVPCGLYSPCAIGTFTNYHLKTGKKFPEDFPSDWLEKQQEEERVEKAFEDWLKKKKQKNE